MEEVIKLLLQAQDKAYELEQQTRNPVVRQDMAQFREQLRGLTLNAKGINADLLNIQQNVEAWERLTFPAVKGGDS